MRNSDIFENFAKIAEKNGIISTDKPAKPAKLAEHTEKNLDNPRWDSLSKEQIEKLYSVKPDMPKEMEYKNNIMETAHPNKAVLFMSHDKLNSLVENNIERQNIILHILDKVPDGQLTQHKYAEKQLILSLVRLGNDLNNSDQSELCALSDVCLEQATSKKKVIFKTALVPAAAVGGSMLLGPVGIIALIATTLGIIYYKNHTDMHSSGFVQDFNDVNDILDKIENSEETLGFGFTYRQSFIDMIKKFQTDLNTLYDFYTKNMLPYLDKLQVIDPDVEGGAAKLVEVAQSSIPQDLTNILNQYKQLAKVINAKITRAIALFEQPGFRQQQIEHEGKLSEIAEATPGLFGGNGLIANIFQNLVHALNTFQADIIESINGIDKASETAKNSQQALEATNQSFDKATSPSANETSTDEFSPEEAYEKWKNK